MALSVGLLVAVLNYGYPTWMLDTVRVILEGVDSPGIELLIEKYYSDFQMAAVGEEEGEGGGKAGTQLCWRGDQGGF